jgi:K+-sensing histidine kinase KdpD
MMRSSVVAIDQSDCVALFRPRFGCAIVDSTLTICDRMAGNSAPASASSERLQILYDVTRRLATFTDLNEVVQFATRRARELFRAEGCALILLDRERNEFTFPVSSQRESGAAGAAKLAEIRFPADQGIAGWVLEHDEAALVEDTAADPRFYSGVDRETAIQTRCLLCAPLRTGTSSIGVIEVINPAAEFLDREQLQFLETLGNEIAVAHEKASLYGQLRGEVLNMRKVCRIAGFSLGGVGFVLAVLTAAAHRARVLPWWELPMRRGMIAAILLVAGAVALLAVARGRLASSSRKETI